jgi:hypothetical protein
MTKNVPELPPPFGEYTVDDFLPAQTAPVEYVETTYLSCGDVVRTPVRDPAEKRIVKALGYCGICQNQD